MNRTVSYPLLALLACLLFAGTASGRKWTDDTGRFTVEADFVQVLNGNARLKKVSGVIISVPLERLSKADVDFIKGLLAIQQPPQEKVGALAKIEQALARKTRLEFVETPLRDVVDFLQDFYKVPIVVDYGALDDIGLGADTPVTARQVGVSLEAALDRLLAPLKLTWMVRHEALFITTLERAESLLETRVYKTLKPGDGDALIEEVTKVVPDSWDEVGGPGSLEFLPQGALVISQTRPVHRQIEMRFQGILKAVKPKPARVAAIAGVKIPIKALTSPVKIHLIETPLQDGVDFLQDFSKVEIEIDKRALQAEGLTANAPVSAELSDVSLASVLSILLEQHGLVWLTKDDKISITTSASAAAQIIPVTYDVGDFAFKGRIDGLMEVVMSTVRPSSWTEVRGPASLRDAGRGSMVVRQTFWGHQDVANLLEDLRACRKRMD